MTAKHYSLKRIFHMQSEQEAATVHAQRFTSTSSLVWDFTVAGEKLFACLTADVVGALETIWRQEISVQRLWTAVPTLAQGHYLVGLLIEEILATNDIEGVRSTRKEIAEALKEGDSPRTKRFHEMAALYRSLLADDAAKPSFPRQPSDVRKLYDELVGSEIAASDQPDGDLFRLGEVSIVDGIRSIHRAPNGEEDVTQRIRTFIDSQHVDHNVIVNVLIGHFLFEYTHPFYDGNGRVGRFLLAMKLSEVLSVVSALSLSHQFSFQRKRYYSAFQSVEEPLNRAEATFYLRDLLEILIDAQGDVINSLQEKHAQLASVRKHLDEGDFSEYSCGILHAIAQAELFGPDGAANFNEIVESSPSSRTTLRKEAAILEDNELIAPTSRRPLAFALTSRGRELLGLGRSSSG